MRWVVAGILILLVGCAAVLRFSRIASQSLWLDEFWIQYLATGRGNAVFQLPMGVILDPPPQVGFTAAPHWWHIWTGVSSQTHPPLYNIVLRWWIDLFGDSDLAERGLSACLSLCAVVIFFIVLLYDRGPWPALAGGAVLAFAPAQIDLSQQVRPYALLVLLTLLCCWSLLSIQRRGWTWARAAAVCATALAMLLTHYFAMGPLMGMGLFALIFMRGSRRRAALGALALAALIALAMWGPLFFSSFHSELAANVDFGRAPDSTAASILNAAWTAPGRLTLMVNNHLAWSAASAIALLVLAAPLLVGKSATAWLWWLWMVFGIGVLTAFDLLRHGILLGQIRYTLAAAPAVYALATAPLGKHPAMRWICPTVIVLCVGIAGFDRYLLGPPPQADWKQAAAQLHRAAAPDDLIIFAGPSQINRRLRYAEADPQFMFIAFRHYAPAARQAVMFVTEPLPPATLNELAHRPRVWVVGQDPTRQTAQLFPGWRYAPSPSPPGTCIWRIFP
jgi:uncharacterized membrane protein